jgi:hypothetical protein
MLQEVDPHNNAYIHTSYLATTYVVGLLDFSYQALRER